MAWVQNTGGVPYYVMCVYLPSGGLVTAEREEMQRRIANEVLAWAHVPGVICGDFNTSVENSHLLSRLQPLGWKIPIHVTCSGTPQDFTYMSAGKKTRIDDIIVHPELHEMGHLAVLSPIPGLQHCLLSTQSMVQEREKVLPVRHPPCIPTAKTQQNVTPICWTEAERRAHECYVRVERELASDTWSGAQELIDGAWKEYQALLAHHLRACNSPPDASGDRWIEALGRDWKRAPRRPVKQCKSTDAVQQLRIGRKATKRLITCAPGRFADACGPKD